MKKHIPFSSAFNIALSIALAGTLLFSCANSEYSDFEKSESGLRYKFHVKSGDSVCAKYGEVIQIRIAKRLGDSVLEASSLVNPDGLQQLLQKGAFPGAIEEGITMMAVGDSATFLVNTDSINKYYPSQDSSKNFKPNTYLAFDIKLMGIQTQEEIMMERERGRQVYVQERKEKEPQELSLYINDNHIDAKPSKTGLYLLQKEKGQGIMPKDGDSVTVHYTGSFLDGTIFDSSVKRSIPFGFVVGAEGPRSVIPGWNEAIKMMKKGAVATIIIPSSLAYDSLGYMNPQTGKYFIPPYSPMKFDIQLLDISGKK